MVDYSNNERYVKIENKWNRLKIEIHCLQYETYSLFRSFDMQFLNLFRSKLVNLDLG